MSDLKKIALELLHDLDSWRNIENNPIVGLITIDVKHGCLGVDEAGEERLKVRVAAYKARIEAAEPEAGT